MLLRLSAPPERTPPRRFNYLKTPPLASQVLVTDASLTFVKSCFRRIHLLFCHITSSTQEMDARVGALTIRIAEEFLQER